MGTVYKWFLGSKTLWFNLLDFAVAVASNFGFAGFTPDAHLAEYITVAVAVINIILRLVTTQPLTFDRAKTIDFNAVKPGARRR
jgi:hypothetical protein